MEEGIIFPRKNVPDVRIDRGTPACKADTLTTELPRPDLVTFLSFWIDMPVRVNSVDPDLTAVKGTD